MVDPRKLEALVAVVENGSFSKAARRVRLSQPTVSGHIRDLEEHFELKLFDRHTRRVEPTRAGRILYEYARRILLLYRKLEREMALFKGLRAGPLEVGGSTIPGQYILPYLIRDFRRDYPDIEVFLRVGDTHEIIEAVERGELEVGMVGAQEEAPSLVFVPALEDEIVLVSGNERFPERLSPRDLSHWPLIAREEGSGTWQTVQSFLREQGLSLEEVRIVARMGSTEAVKQAVKAGLGLGFVSRRAVEDELRAGTLRIVKLSAPPIRRDFYLVYARERTLSPPAQAFLNFIRNLPEKSPSLK
ncbi:LysR family transcriptional regulator [Thermosulfurimonas marina]|uniref:LysR family transcriptional regulator n=1 Tax=Thermosulfurimonas marina TaxID=2047767 RepID=A0A6H1WSN7_9BACT|nr:selenium metabolism-associated LysR family transcriptional regulator [Thermosulfurimonas marina]QJA06213.1 LysR family transcriptional regulator [Thermosulfurimonas marina]